MILTHPNQLVIDVFESSVTVSTARGQKMVAPVAEAYLYNHFDIWTVGGGIALAVEEIEGKYNQGDVSLNTLPGITHDDFFFLTKSTYRHWALTFTCVLAFTLPYFL